jgi:small basic protein (TIGR04137 family)
VGTTVRNVLKRHERVRHLMEHGLWVDGRSVLGLPKIKQLKIKTRKAAAKEEKESAGTATPAAPAAPAAAASKPASK